MNDNEWAIEWEIILQMRITLQRLGFMNMTVYYFTDYGNPDE